MKNLLNRLLLCMALVAVPALAEEAPVEEAPLDEVTLKNGSRILGTLTDVRDGVLTVETDFAGTLSISADQVSAVKANGSCPLRKSTTRGTSGSSASTETGTSTARRPARRSG